MNKEEWYTPSWIVWRVKHVLGSIDLDPASCPGAQFTVRAKEYFNKEQDGLSRPWHGNVFLNPPYTRGIIDRFINKLSRERYSGRVKKAIVITNNSTDTGWGQSILMEADAVCFLNKRVHFVSEDGQSKGTQPRGQMVSAFGVHVPTFIQAFRLSGTTMSRQV